MAIALFVSVEMDLSDAFAGLDSMARPPLPRAFAFLKAPLRFDQKEHASAKAGPEGAWPARASSTLERYSHMKKPPKRIMGKLPTAVTYAATASSVTATSRAKWSEVHQVGGRVGRGSMLPARPFLWLSDKMLAIAEDAFAGATLTAFVNARGKVVGFAGRGG